MFGLRNPEEISDRKL